MVRGRGANSQVRMTNGSLCQRWKTANWSGLIGPSAIFSPTRLTTGAGWSDDIGPLLLEGKANRTVRRTVVRSRYHRAVAHTNFTKPRGESRGSANWRWVCLG